MPLPCRALTRTKQLFISNEFNERTNEWHRIEMHVRQFTRFHLQLKCRRSRYNLLRLLLSPLVSTGLYWHFGPLDFQSQDHNCVRNRITDESVQLVRKKKMHSQCRPDDDDQTIHLLESREIAFELSIKSTAYRGFINQYKSHHPPPPLPQLLGSFFDAPFETLNKKKTICLAFKEKLERLRAVYRRTTMRVQVGRACLCLARQPFELKPLIGNQFRFFTLQISITIIARSRSRAPITFSDVCVCVFGRADTCPSHLRPFVPPIK